MNAGDIVEDQTGDRGVVRRVGPPRMGDEQGVSVMVEWSTVDGQPVRLMASWEDVSDLTLIEAAQPVASGWAVDDG